MYDHVFSSIPVTPEQIDDAILSAKAARSDALSSLLSGIPDLFRQAYARIRPSNQRFTAISKRS